MSDHLVTLGRTYVDKRRKADRLKIEFEEAERQKKDAEAALWEALADARQKTTVLELGEGYGDFQFQRSETVTSIVLDDKKAAAALQAKGHPEVVGKPEIRRGVLNSLVRGWKKRGEPFPEGVSFKTRRYITLTSKGD